MTHHAPMHLLTEQSVDIARPASTVYRHASDLDRFGEWFPGVLAIASVDAQPHASVGKVYLETVDLPGRGRTDVRVEVREARPDTWLATEGDLQPLLPRMELQLDAPTPHTCRLTWRMWSRHPGDEFMRATFWPAAAGLISQRAAEGLARLKHQLEQIAP